MIACQNAWVSRAGCRVGLMARFPMGSGAPPPGKVLAVWTRRNRVMEASGRRHGGSPRVQWSACRRRPSGRAAWVGAVALAAWMSACGDSGGGVPLCGDGYCDPAETVASCPTDCAQGCPATDFDCGDQECVSPADVCDGTPDCANAADEDPMLCAGCEASQFDCGDGVCLEAAQTCDGTPQCANGADEDLALCGAGCSLGDWQCQDGGCVADTFVCDGEQDCLDGSDEDSTLCATCVERQSYPCESGDAVISLGALCDGVADCDDQSDEVYCAPCPAGETACPSGFCILESWQCDGFNDCGDCADESGC